MNDQVRTIIRALFQWAPDAALSLMAIEEITGLSRKQIVAALRVLEHEGHIKAVWHRIIYLWEWNNEPKR